MTFPDSRIDEAELESYIREMNDEFDREQEERTRFERIFKRAITAFVLATLVLILVAAAGCGGGEIEPEPEPQPPCRVDFVGPPAPGDLRPICKGYI